MFDQRSKGLQHLRNQSEEEEEEEMVTGRQKVESMISPANS